ncbi:uncharacterized protein [Dysidea avara]|uniref:uncharacterized protein n=1 Tax=Dysidea avara TaxID=196820 RepID=UPI003318CF1A
MTVLKVVASIVTMMSILLCSNCEQSNETLPYYCTVDVPSESSLSFITYLGITVGNSIYLRCEPQCQQLSARNQTSTNYIETISLELETFRGLMKLTLDGPCAVLEEKATVLPLKYFDQNSTYDLEYCKQVECTFKEANRRIARFVMAQKCGCDDTCEYSPGKVTVPTVPEGQNITIKYLTAQQWISHLTLIRNINIANIR